MISVVTTQFFHHGLKVALVYKQMGMLVHKQMNEFY